MLQQFERVNDPKSALLRLVQGWQTQIWTTLPAIVKKFDSTLMTVDVQPAIQGVFTDRDGKDTNVTMPLCPAVPIIFPRGGGYSLTFPLAVGDEGLLIFAARCTDAWWNSSGVQPQAELRMHDLSDGFFIPGCYSKPKAPAAAASTNSTQLRSDDGLTYLELKGNVLNVIAAGGMNVTATAGMNVTGNFKVTGNIDATAAFSVHEGTGITRISVGSGVSSFPPLNSTVQTTQTFSVPGARVGDRLIWNMRSAQHPMVVTNAWISGNDTASVAVSNVDRTAASQPTNTTFDFMAISTLP